MKVKIGNYKNWIGPYQIADWFKPIFGDERIEKFTDGKLFEKVSDWFMPLFTFIEEHKPKRVEKVHIDRWDSYSADHTLSLIIVPLLKQLKEDKHGSPQVDDADVPEELRSTSAPALKPDESTDELWHKRWEWVMDEMIFAFTAIRDENWESQFHTGTSDWVEEEVVIPADEHGEDDVEGDLVMYEVKEGPNNTAKFDSDGYKAFQERIINGTTLFGKYYFGLWD